MSFFLYLFLFILVKPIDNYKSEFENPCFSMPCFNAGKCNVLNGVFQCECQPGFHGVYCEAGWLFFMSTFKDL